MKKILLTFALLLALCVPWAHGQTLNEGFESTTFPPDDWTSIHVSGADKSWARNTSDHYSGSACAYMNYGGYGTWTYNWLITPQLAPKTGESLSFYVKYGSSGTTNVYVKVSTTDDSPGSFSDLQNITSQITQSWTNVSIDLSAYVGQKIFIGFYVEDNFGKNIFIDDVSGVSLFLPSCALLQSVSTTTTRTSVTANWVKKATSVNCIGYEVKLSTSSNPDDAGISTQTISDPATTTYTFEHLERETQYYVHVRSNCGTDDGYSEWITASATTKALLDCPIVTVADGTGTNNYIPVYGGYCDELQKTQSIYPASMLTELVGKTISKLKYYVTSGGSSNWSSAVFNIKMKIVEATTLSGLLPTTDATVVYTGTLSASVAGGMEINLTTPFTYTGGNLLIMFDETSTGGYGDCTFRGTEVSSASYLDNVGWGVGTYSFLPKVDFGYCESAVACPAVTNLVVSDIAQTTANISWTASTGDYANDYDLVVSKTPVTDFSEVTPRHPGLTVTDDTLMDLEAYTDYYVYVRVNCDGYGYDDGEAWSEEVHFKTLSYCITPTDFTVTPLTKTSAKAQWTATAQASNYRYILSTEELENPDNETATASGITGSNVLLNRLTPGETYYLYLSNQCGGDDGNSPYIFTTFTMPDACLAPTEINITDVQKYQMTLNWTPSVYADPTDVYDIIVSTTEIADFTTAVPTYSGITGNSKVLDVLQRNTLYYIYLRCNCGEGGNADWASVTETTLDLAPDCDNLQNVAVGSASTSSPDMPANAYCNYGISEQIYTASELGQAGTIKSLSFYCTKNGGYSRNFTVYLAHTSKSAFSSSTDWITVSESDAVYSGNCYITNAAWNTITLTTPFEYNGTDNLVVIFDDNTGSYTFSYAYYQVHTAASKTLYYSDDNTNVNPTASSISKSGTVANNRNNMRFGFCAPSPACPAVDAPVASDVTNIEATITWNQGNGDFATSYDLVVSSTPVNDFEGVALTADDVEDITFTVTGLAANTHYYAYVRVNCVNDIYDDGSSVWSPAGEFTTELACLKPENFVAASPLSDRVELSWIKKGTAADWRIYVDTFDIEIPDWLPGDTLYVNAADCQIVEDTVTYLLTGLQPEKYYKFALLADCGEVDSLSKFATGTPSIFTFSINVDIDTMTISSAEVLSTEIDRTAKTIEVIVRKGSDLEAMVGSIETNHSAAQVRVNGEAFVAPWNLSAPVTVTVLAQDTNITANWTITVTEEPCATPFNVAATDVERRTANLNWNIGDVSTSFDLVISETELEDPATGSVQTITAANEEGTCTYALTGLTRGTHYYIYIRTNCGETFGQWRGTELTTKSLLVCDDSYTLSGYNSNTTTSLPVYGYYANQAERTQSIYPASELSSMVGRKISALKYFVSSGTNAEYWDMAPFTVKLAETTATSLSSAFVDTEMTTVYTGTLTANSTDNMVVNFDTPFEYKGGNLLIEFSKESGYYSNSVTFYAKYATSGSSRYKTSSEYSSNYLPRIEFTLCDEIPACPEVTNVAVNSVAETSATVTWTESTGDYANTSDIYYSTTEVTNFTGIEPQVTGATGNSAEVTGLEPYTIYYVYVRTHCDGEGQDDGISPWAGGASFRTLSPCRVPGTPEATVTGKHTATVAWTNTSESAQADNFTYIVSATPIAEADLESAMATATAYSNTTVDLTGLNSETTYYFYVRNVCTGDVNCNSPWDSCQFPMPVAMPAVLNLQAYNIVSNAFTATWESDLANLADETAWEVACVAHDTAPESWTEVAAREYFALGLTPETQYDFYVRAKDGASYSANAMVNVTTLAAPTACQTIGDGTSTSYGPICGFYGYERNIYLFFPEDGLAEGTIEKIAWRYSTSGKTIPAKIYLKNTSLTDLSTLYNGTFNAAIDGATLVYDASVTTVSGWLEIDITDFDYTGGNLMVLVASNCGGGGNASQSAYYTTSSHASTHIASRQDNSYDDETQIMSATNGKACDSNRHNIQFCFVFESCHSVTKLVVDNITATTARAHWYPGAAETEWQVYNSTEKLTKNDLTALTAADYTTVTAVPQITYSALTKDMDYYFYVRGVCGEGDTSNWKEAHYITLPSCSAPATAVASSEADNSITFTASAGEYGTEGTYDYRYWIVGTTDTTTVAGQTSEYTATDLTACVNYAWEVRANCSGVDEGASRWVAGNTVHVCGAITLPYSESFESVSTDYTGPGITEPICWSDLNAAPNNVSLPRYNAAGEYATEGSKTLKFFSSNTTPLYVLLPPLADATQCQVKFDCSYDDISKSGRIQVGYLTDPTDASTFVPAFTDAPTANYTMVAHTVNIFNIPEGARVAFGYTAGNVDNYYAWLDDVRVDTIPYYNVATAVAPEVTPVIGSVEVACNEIDTVSAGVFYGGTTPVFTAVPNEGIEFINWTNGNNGDTLATVNPWSFSIEQDTLIVANFDTASFNLNVVVAPGHDIFGEVAGSGIFRYGRTVNYSATPMEHYSVVWEDENTDNNRSIVMPTHDTTIVAHFAIDKHTLTVAMNDSSKGVVTGTGVYDYGTFVDITAAPIDPVHMIFAGWSNGETDPAITIDLQGDSTVTANFIWDEHTVTTDVNDPSMGSVTGAGTYTHDDVARLVATPTDHHIFVEWSNGLTDDIIDITVVSDTALTATFDWDSHDILANVNIDSMGTVDGTGNYYHGTEVTLTAVPAAHHHFVEWSNGVTTPTWTVIADNDSTVTAIFAIDKHTVTLLENIAGRGTQTGAGTYDYGTPVQISTTPTSSHYVFDGWDNGETDATVIINLVSDTTITANYIWDQHTITGLVNIDSMGTVEGSATVEHGTEVTLTAVSAAHHHFVEWSNGVTTPTWTVIADNDSTVTAIFAIDQHTITAVPVDTVRGKVTGGGVYNYGDTAKLIAVGKFPYQFSRWDDENLTELDTFKVKVLGDATYTAYFKYNEFDVIARSDDQTMGMVVGGGAFVYDTIVNVTAIPNDHYHFVRWNNGSVDPTATVIVRGDTILTAYFAIDEHIVTANVNNTVLGTVAGAGTYSYGASVTLTATPSAHAVFTGWSDGATANPYTFTLAGDTTVTAIFSYDTHVIAATANDAAMGSITGAGTYTHGTLASLTAVANAHYHFVNWSNGLTTNTFSILVDKDSTVTANFAIDQHVVTTNVNNNALGTVAGAGTYNYGASVTLTATPSAHAVFTGWSDGATANPYTFTLAGDTTVTAIFSYDTHVIAATANDAAMGSITGAGTYTHGTLASLTAVANAHYHFVNWSNGLTTNTFSILVDKDSSVVANFAIDEHVVTANVNDNALGTVAGAGTYNYGASVTLTATPSAHGVFTGWSDGVTANPYTFTLAGDTTVTAIFSYDTHVIAATANDAAMGSITGAGTYTHGTLASLTAVANAHYHFVNWSNGLTTNTFSILVDKDSSVVANFAIDEHIVTTNVNNNALGSVAGAGTYNYGASVTLTATPTAHGVFTGWSDGVTANPYTFTLAGDTTVTAIFSYDTHVIAATANDAAMGSITGAGTYTHGTLASLTAVANAHYHFVNWSNGLTTNTFSILVDKDSSVVANFAIDEHVVTATSGNAVLGSVTGSGTYNYGASVTLTATPSAHGVFTGWSNGVTANPYTFSITGDVNITANFSYDTHTIAANVNSTIMGSVAGAGTYTHGTLATLVATPNAHYHFTGWSNGLTANTFSILVDKDSTVTANFAIDQHNVSAIVNDESMGSVTGTGAYNYGSTASLTAVPAANYHFVGWNTGNTNVTQTVNVTGDITFIATFAINQHTVTVISNDINLGVVTGTGYYDYGDQVVITAVPTDNHYSFMGWSNGLTTPSAVINVTKDTVITATFVRNVYNITLNVNDATMGSVTGAGTYTYGDVVTIEATPVDDCHSFVRWSDGMTTEKRTFSVAGDVALTAFFAMDNYTISVASSDKAGGVAYCDKSGSHVSSMKVTCGTLVEIHAEPEQYYRFVEWSDGVTDAIRQVEATSDSDLVAIFEPNCGDLADFPVVFMYNGLIMLDLDSVRARGYNPKPNQVTWYQVVGDVDNIEVSFPADDKLICSGYYLSLPTNNLGYGQYYAVIDVSNTREAICHDKMKSVVVEYTSEGKNINVQMAPTHVKSGDVMTITGLIPDERTTITVYDFTGKTVDVMQTEGLDTYDITAHGATGVYMVKVTSDSVNETLKFIVTK